MQNNYFSSLPVSLVLHARSNPCTVDNMPLHVVLLMQLLHVLVLHLRCEWSTPILGVEPVGAVCTLHKDVLVIPLMSVAEVWSRLTADVKSPPQQQGKADHGAEQGVIGLQAHDRAGPANLACFPRPFKPIMHETDTFIACQCAKGLWAFQRHLKSWGVLELDERCAIGRCMSS